MMVRSWILAGVGTVMLMASPAEAQYKNTQLNFDIGYWLPSKPSAFDNEGRILPGDEKPLRLPGALRLGGETAFKMDADRWWFFARLNVALFLNSGNSLAGTCTLRDDECLNAKYDAASDANVGDLVGLQGMMGIRYVFLSDRIRPYAQAGLSFMRLFSFKSSASNSQCVDPQLCQELEVTGENFDNFVPHPNVGGIGLQFGLEWVFARDFAWNVFVDTQRWLVFNAEGNWAFVFGTGVNLFI